MPRMFLSLFFSLLLSIFASQSFASPAERPLVAAIERAVGRNIVRRTIDGFDYKAVADVIKLPPDYEIAFMIAIGKGTKSAWPKPGQLLLDQVGAVCALGHFETERRKTALGRDFGNLARQDVDHIDRSNYPLRAKIKIGQ